MNTPKAASQTGTDHLHHGRDQNNDPGVVVDGVVLELGGVGEEAFHVAECRDF